MQPYVLCHWRRYLLESLFQHSSQPMNRVRCRDGDQEPNIVVGQLSYVS